ncbi:cupin domain-containing protein [Echinicola soli]|uniref:Cupin domain-containing protein n=1 Tax=Echinicola soli TaxID=2591634 RepID=A0A514CFE8_9BACT|nr:cupin domain-containing protein [Echinicola soli]QDH78555.1 cupin domain-containing protein [Echinicola soli]
MSKPFKKYKLSDTVTLQVLSYTDEMMTAKLWFSGKGFDGTHHHSNQEVNVVVAGEFEATNGKEKHKVYPGQTVVVPSNNEHNMECLSPTGAMVSCWTPARKDIIENYTELEE